MRARTGRDGTARQAGGRGQGPGEWQITGRHDKGTLMGGLTALALVVVAYTLVASKLDRWGITGPMVFVAAGVILGPGGLDGFSCVRCDRLGAARLAA